MSLADEDLLSMAELARTLPTNCSKSRSRHLNPLTLVRWHTKGKRVGGEVIRLEAVARPSGFHTSKAALMRFFEAIQVARTGAVAPTVRGPAGVRKERTALEKQADADMAFLRSI